VDGVSRLPDGTFPPRPDAPRRGHTITHPPFEPGNVVGVRHGSYLPEAMISREERTQQLAQMIMDTQPVRHAGDVDSIQRLAVCLRRVERGLVALEACEERLAEAVARGDYDAALDDLAERLQRHLRAWLKMAADAQADLGRTPTSRARLGLDVIRTQQALADYLAENYGRDGDA
jgi:hypothetical protein